MKRTLTKKDITKIEKETVFSIKDTGKGYEFSWYTNAGEDFGFDVYKGDELIRDIIDYCFGFDPEEHVKMWIGGPGAPDIFTLCDDAKEIVEELGKLAYIVDNL